MDIKSLMTKLKDLDSKLSTLEECFTKLNNKVPGLLEMFDDVMHHQTKFKDIQLAIIDIKKEIAKLKVSDITPEEIKKILNDFNNIKNTASFFQEVYKVDKEGIKNIFWEVIKSKKEELVEDIWKSFEKKLQARIGERVIMVITSAGTILGIIYFIYNMVINNGG